MNSIGIKIFSGVVIAILMASFFIPLRYTTYCNWSLVFYSPNSSSNQMYKEYHPSAYDHYRVAATNSGRSGNRDFYTVVSLNGVTHNLYNQGDFHTFNYNGTTSPTLSFSFVVSNGYGDAYMSGDVQVYND